MDTEEIWHEAIVLALIAIFSFLFYSVENEPLYWAFILLSVMLWFVAHHEERQKGISKTHKEYFHHTSSYFIVAALFFALSLLYLSWFESSFVLVTLSVSIIAFSIGFMRVLFARLE